MSHMSRLRVAATATEWSIQTFPRWDWRQYNFECTATGAGTGMASLVPFRRATPSNPPTPAAFSNNSMIV